MGWGGVGWGVGGGVGVGVRVGWGVGCGGGYLSELVSESNVSCHHYPWHLGDCLSESRDKYFYMSTIVFFCGTMYYYGGCALCSWTFFSDNKSQCTCSTLQCVMRLITNVRMSGPSAQQIAVPVSYLVVFKEELVTPLQEVDFRVVQEWVALLVGFPVLTA